MNRILVIRGGAIGDFVLTLPAIKLLRDRFPKAHIEILGRQHIAALAEKRFYADAVRSIESASLARFFVERANLPGVQRQYFADFELILSYLSDPDRIFEANLNTPNRQIFLAGSPKLDGREHAALQLARPLEALGLGPIDPAPRLFPSEHDRRAVASLRPEDGQWVAIHPGSGSETKNWPILNWIELGNSLLAAGQHLLVISGEADVQRTERLKAAWKAKPVRFVEDLSLPHLAALLEGAHFVGHDSGISHIAAAAGARCLLLFGPTDPAIWAPANKNVTVLRGSEGTMESLETDSVYELMRMGIRT